MHACMSTCSCCMLVWRLLLALCSSLLAKVRDMTETTKKGTPSNHGTYRQDHPTNRQENLTVDACALTIRKKERRTRSSSSPKFSPNSRVIRLKFWAHVQNVRTSVIRSTAVNHGTGDGHSSLLHLPCSSNGTFPYLQAYFPSSVLVKKPKCLHDVQQFKHKSHSTEWI